MTRRRRLITFFEEFETSLNSAIQCDDAGAAAAARAYAPAFITSDREGARCVTNDDGLTRAIVARCESYRKLGARALRLEGIDSTPVDDDHVMARVHWLAEYRRANDTDVAVTFETVYLVRFSDVQIAIIASISGDEQRQLEAHGLTRT